jgi:hypothetical protein
VRAYCTTWRAAEVSQRDLGRVARTETEVAELEVGASVSLIVEDQQNVLRLQIYRVQNEVKCNINSR